jgi:D-alanyl-D-alanine carboxypeptidase (penicillin-binding protein 5/6)
MDRTTGTVLYEKNADEPLAPASVTKVMTLLLVLEAIDRGQLGWDDTVTASATAAAKGGSQIYLEEGEQMSVHDMVKCVVVSSANDCATALAEAVSGSESGFVELMNQRAAELGMENIAIMSRELLSHDEIREFTTIWMDTVRDGTFGLSNTNKLVRFYSGTTGLKTGFTSSAGYCMSASAERDGMELIATVMHCESSTDRFESAKALLDYGFATYTLLDPLSDTELEAVPVELGAEETVEPVLQSGDALLLEKAKAAGVTREISLAENVNAPVEAGQVLGTLTVKNGEEVLSQVPLVAKTSVSRLSWGQLFSRITGLLWMAQ